MTVFNKLLIANRGEIAVRIMATAQALGYRCIAVYSEADADSPHVQLADEAVLLGAAPASESYLDVDKILQAARQTGAEAVHPGYGFLSENAGFARACEAAGLVFIGPSPEAIALMGNKAHAKARMLEAGVPCIPGRQNIEQTDAALQAAAIDIGYPLMVKAAAGGGGRGMRLVQGPDSLAASLQAARVEAGKAFADDELILERAIARPRHVEVQVFADAHGQVIHLGERDCSVQRRHQKVIEEAPCPVMTPELRAAMGAAAVNAARTIDYRGAGTVEFLLDAEGAFYFMEMNTRLQVEHPVTELVTGLDLVGLQLLVAQGRPLGLCQQDISISGHAIEARLYAEDPARNFLPRTGRIQQWSPALGQGVRVDSGISSGQEITPYYDPMLAKVVAWGENRDVARRRLIQALIETRLFGTDSNRGFLVDVLAHPVFAEGSATTDFVARYSSKQSLASPPLEFSDAALAALLLFRLQRQRAAQASRHLATELLDWSSNGCLASRYLLVSGETCFDLLLKPLGQDTYRLQQDGQSLLLAMESMDQGMARVRVGDELREVYFYCQGADCIELSQDGYNVGFVQQISSRGGVGSRASEGPIRAPMHGALVEVLVEKGERVARGQRLAMLEAMKMQHDILADRDGVVASVQAGEGDQVSANDVLFEFEVCH